MQKGKIIIIAVLCIVFVVAIFGYFIFSKKKTVNITMQNSVESIQKTEDSVQQTTDNQQVATDSVQQTEDNNPSSVINNQESTDSKQTDKTNSSGYKIINKFVSWGFQKSSSRKIDTIIIHSTYDAIGNDPYSIDGIIAEYKQYGVSPHYLIARDGTIYHLVADQNIAYHAGASKMPDGRTNVNDFSIGIEMANTTDGKFTNDQYAALNQLIASLKKQYPIKYILGHDDIAPSRKTDPWNIDWSKVQK